MSTEQAPSTSDDRDDDQPTTAQELVEKHGRDRIEKLAADDNTAAQAVLNIVDEKEGRR
jgi:hypothetical protein